MTDVVRPVRHGLLMGLAGIAFGMLWAFWLALGHDAVMSGLEAAMKQEEVQRVELMEASFQRLGMGHSHSMGLGLLTIAVSFVYAFTSASVRVKAIGSLLSGMGGLLFPVAWIIMGWKTPALGIDGAHAAVAPMAGISVLLILSGLVTAAACLIRDAVK